MNKFDLMLAVHAARMYYLDDVNKSDIAKALNISRFKVARLIKEARDCGAVKIEIASFEEINFDLSEKLCTAFGLRHAVVVDIRDRDHLTAELGQAAASYLESVLTPHMAVGFAWGATVSEVADALKEIPEIRVVQAAGSIPDLDFKKNSIDLVHRVASINHGTPYPIYLPMWIEDEDAVQRLRQDPQIEKINEALNSIELLVTGIGNWESGSSYLCQKFPKAWTESLKRRHVITDICTTMIDVNGQSVESPVEKYGFGLTTEQLKKIPEVIGVAGGHNKVKGILACLRGHWLTTLITDSEAARLLLENRELPPSS